VRTTVKLDSVGALIEGRHENPFELLGPHEVELNGGKALAVRAYLPQSKQVWLAHGSHTDRQPMRRIHPSGLYEAICPWPGQEGISRYKFFVEDTTGQQMTIHDPYSFPPLLSDFDLHLMCEGRHWRAYDKLGAHARTIDGVTGVNFSVWGPNARGISIVGDFNNWDGRRHAMRKHIPSGIWELFVPGPERWRSLQVPREPARTHGRQVGSVWIRGRGAAVHRFDRDESRRFPME
jgi:1,4-alpha-glucan branching enzyme